MAEKLHSERRRYSAGEDVHAFYRSTDHDEGSRYLAVESDEATNCFPFKGRAASWLPATIIDDFDPGMCKENVMNSWVHVRFVGQFRDPRRGARDGLEMHVHPDSVIKSGRDVPVPVLSFFCLRWWDYQAETGWCDSNASNDQMFVDMFGRLTALDSWLRNEYEIYTAFVSKSADLARLRGDSVRNLLRASHVSACYFLWPSKIANDVDMQAGCVCEDRFFAMCQQFERAGIPTGWPNPAHMYKILFGDLWAPQMCLQSDYKVPATTRVHYAEYVEAPREVAVRAIECLRSLRQYNTSRTEVAVDDMRGVVKLGFSSGGNDVLPFCGTDSLVRVLNKLFSQPSSTQLVTVVQEMVADVVCELRVVCVHDALNDCFQTQRVWIRMREQGKVAKQHGECEVSQFALASDCTASEDAALREFFRGSAEAKRRAESEANELAEWWQLWYSTECPEPPPVLRLDFLVSLSPNSELPSLWTCGVNEGSASMCNIEVSARNTAILNSMMQNDDSGRFPKTLPADTDRAK